MPDRQGFDLRAHDVTLMRALRALPDRALDRARAHVAAGLPMRRADLGWEHGNPADDGCVVGVSMSRATFLRHPLRIPGLLLLAAVFDSWTFQEANRLGDTEAIRSRQVPLLARERLGLLLDLEGRRRGGWTPDAEPAPQVSAAGR